MLKLAVLSNWYEHMTMHVAADDFQSWGSFYLNLDDAYWHLGRWAVNIL